MRESREQTKRLDWLFYLCWMCQRQMSFNMIFQKDTMALVTPGLLTIVQTGITIVSYFSNVTAFLFALTTVIKFTSWWSKAIETTVAIVIPKQGSWVNLMFKHKQPIRMWQFFLHTARWQSVKSTYKPMWPTRPEIILVSVEWSD